MPNRFILNLEQLVKESSVAENKTQPTQLNVQDFIESVDHAQRRADAKVLINIFEEVLDEPVEMWGSSIVGYGCYQYQTADGKQHQFMRAGFSPRKQNMSVYCMVGFSQMGHLLARLGKYKTSQSCLYINKLSDIDIEVLKEIIRFSWDEMQRRHPD
jgi:hypothetical protein